MNDIAQLANFNYKPNHLIFKNVYVLAKVYK